MKKLLPRSAFLDIGRSLKPGETTHVFHCREGKDNDRLFITKKYDGKILAFCHHCGAKAVYITKDFRLPHEIPPLRRDDKIIIPYVEYSIKKWPEEAVIWLAKARIGYPEIKTYRIGYIPSTQRVYLPIYRWFTLIAYQSRKLFKWDNGPKYITTHIRKNKKIYKYMYGSKRKPNLTIVEDLLSGIRVSKFTDVIVLFGSHFYEELHRYTIPYEHIFIFLDDDNPQIKLKQVEIKDTIVLYNSNVSIIKGQNADPKELSDSQLRRLLLCSMYR